MHTRDFRSLAQSAQAELRRQAFRLTEKGMTTQEVADIIEVHFKTVERWKRDQDTYVWRECYGERRWRRLGEKMMIDADMQNVIRSSIMTHTPDDLGLESVLWDRKTIRELIFQETWEDLIPQTISKYTKRWWLTPQRPKKQATEQNPTKIQQWLEEEYPKIQKRAKKEWAQIHWADETGVNANTSYARSYAPKGETPTIKLPSKKISTSMISSITNQWKLRFMVYSWAMHASLFINFLDRLLKTRDINTHKKIFVIVDNLKVHHSKKVQAWQQRHKYELELFFPTELCTTIQSRWVSQ